MRAQVFFNVRYIAVGLVWTKTPGSRRIDPPPRRGKKWPFMPYVLTVSHAHENLTEYAISVTLIPMLPMVVTWYRAFDEWTEGHDLVQFTTAA